MEDVMATAIAITAAPVRNRARSTKSITRSFPAVARLLMGLPFVFGGLNDILNFVPQPNVPMSAGATAFRDALVNSGYMMHLIFATQLVVGILLLANRYVPLALALIAPFFVNSILFHTFLEHSGLPMAIIFIALELYLVKQNWNAYRPMLAARN
jgi:uncharacterized membrane protein YphA (DoxX/SURF4 family)